MKVAIIVTVRDSELWEKSEGWPLVQSFQQANVRVRAIGDDQLLVLCQAKSNARSDPDRTRESRKTTTSWLVELSNSAGYEGAKIYIGAHEGYADFKELHTKISRGRLSAAAEFSHERQLPAGLFDYLLTFLDTMEEHTFEGVTDCITQTQVRTHADRLRTLKHRLVNVFLPVSIDLSKWQEGGFDDLYLQQIRESYYGDEGRLDRARSLLYVESAVGDNVEKLISEVNLEQDRSWVAIQLLLPPKLGEPSQEVIDRLPENAARGYAEFVNARNVLDSLKDSEDLMVLREKLRFENTFVAWCKQLNAQLSQLIDKVTY